MPSSSPRSRRRTALALLTLLALAGLLLHLLPPLHIATAQIDNTQPWQPFASVVACIRAGADRGLAADQSPRFATSCYASRLHDGGYGAPGGDPANGDAPASDAALVEFGDAQPDNSADLFGAPASGHATLATVGEVGSAYGLAYATGTNPAAPALARVQRLFVAAYHKRLTRFGPGGPGAISLINRSTGSASLYLAVPNVVPGPAGAAYSAGDGTRARFPNDPAGTNPYTPEMGGLHRGGDDAQEQGYVGSASLGDLALDTQERYLYIVNLNDRLVYRADTWSATPLATLAALPAPPLYSVPSTCNASGASGPDDLRPFGLMLSASALYLGFVCSAERSQDRADLSAGVLRYDLATGGWSLVFAADLARYDAERGSALGYRLAWNPWRSNGGASYHYPQPILSGLQLDEDGDLLIGLRDRYADLSSNGRTVGGEAQGAGQGDLLRALPNGSGGWVASPGGSGAEYFADGDDQGAATPYPGDWIHGESAWGGIAYVPGAHDGGYGGEVASTVISPYRVNAGGVGWWDVSGGAATAREELYQTSTQAPNSFQKAAGLGDLVLLCAWRAIGDRIWRDANGNGVQDAGEPDLSGVRVQLLDASGAVVATVTTGPVAGMSGNYRFYVDPFAAYTVRIDPAMFQAGQPLAGLTPTRANAGADDARDSDADAAGRIAVAPAGNGDVNATFDAGLVAPANVTIQKTGPATALPGQRIGYTLRYANAGPGAAQGVQVIDTLPAGLSYVSATPAPSSVSGQTLAWNLGGLAAGASGTIQVSAAIDAGASGALTNRAQIGTTTPGDDPGDDADTVTTTVQRPNVTIQKRGPASVRAGDALTYTLAYANSGDATAAGALVTDTLPIGLTFVRATPAPSSVRGQALTWDLGALAPGAQGTIQVVAQSSGGLASGATLTNTAQIGTTTPGDDPGDNRSAATTTALTPDLSIAKTDGLTLAQPGDTLTYTLTIRNSGPIAASGVVLTETPPLPIRDPAWTPLGDGRYTLALGALGPGATVTRTLVMALPSPLPEALRGRIVNVASVGEPGRADPTPGDTTATDADTPIVGRVGDLVWLDRDGDGVQDAGEPGLARVPLDLLDLVSGQVVTTTATDDLGGYAFDGLRLGRYAVRVNPAARATLYRDYTTTTPDAPSATLTFGAPRDDTLDIGLRPPNPTSVVLAYFLAEPAARGYRVRWGTVEERATAFFRVERAPTPDRAQAVALATLPSQGAQGGAYQLDDPDAPAGTVAYWLVEVETGGQERVYGPIVRSRLYLPLVQ